MKSNIVGFFLLVAALLILPNAALAEARPYISLMGGYTTVIEEDAGLLEDAEFDGGYVAGIAVGYDFDFGEKYGYGNTRLEAEFAYRENDFDQVKFLGQEMNADGSVTSQSLMANGYYFFTNPSIAQPFILFGIGAARVEFDEATVSGVNFIDDDSYNFAWQAGAGVALKMTDSLELDLGYKFFRVANTNFEDALDEDISYSYKTHNYYMGIAYAF